MPVAMLSSSLITEPKRYGRFNALDTVYTPPSKLGMVLIKPTSISHTGTSSTLGANGQVSFSAVSTLNVNGCFTADFDNYMISIQHTNSSADIGLNFQWRASGSNATGTDYTYQQVGADGSSVFSGRTTSSSFARMGVSDSAGRCGHTCYIYGPFLAQPTVYRSISIDSKNVARIYEIAGSHSVSTSYDGFSINTPLGSMTGSLTIYGIRS